MAPQMHIEDQLREADVGWQMNLRHELGRLLILPYQLVPDQVKQVKRTIGPAYTPRHRILKMFKKMATMK